MSSSLPVLQAAFNKLTQATRVPDLTTAITDVLAVVIGETRITLAIPLVFPLTDEVSALAQAAIKAGTIQLEANQLRVAIPLMQDSVQATADQTTVIAVLGMVELERDRAFTDAELATLFSVMTTASARLAQITDRMPAAIYKQLADEAQIAIDFVNLDSSVAYANQAAATLYNRQDAHQLVGRQLAEIYASNQEYVMLNKLWSKQHFRERWIGEVRAINTEGVAFPVQANTFPVLHPITGEILGWGASKQNLTEHRALLAMLEQQQRRLQAAIEVARVINIYTELDGLFVNVAEVIQRLYALDYVAIGMIKSQQIVAEAVHLADGVSNQHHLADLDETSLTGWVGVHGQATLIADGQHSTDPRRSQALGALGSELVVPMRILNKTIGTLGLGHARPNYFTSLDLETMQGIADQLAGAIRNGQLFEAERQRVKQQSVINEISRALVETSFDMDQIWPTLYHAVKDLFHISTFFVVLWDKASDELGFAYLVEDGIDCTDKTLRFPRASFSGWVLQHAKPLRINSIVLEQDRIRQLGIEKLMTSAHPEEPTQSWLGAPLIARDNSVLGLLSIQSTRPNEYTNDHEELLTTIASTVSLAIQNATLFRDLSSTAAKLQERTFRLESILNLSRTLSSALVDGILPQQAAQHLTEIMQVEHCGVVTWEEHAEFGTVLAEYPDMGMLGSAIPIRANPILSSERRKEVTVYHTDHEEPSPLKTLLGTQGIKTLMTMQMTSQQSTIMSIGVDMLSRERDYSNEEIEMFSGIVRQVGLALENAELISKLTERSKRLESLVAFSRLLSFATDRETMLAQVAQQICEILGGDHCGIMMIDDQGLSAAVVAEYPPRGELGRTISLTENTISQEHQHQDLVIYHQAELPDNWLRKDLARQGIQTIAVMQMYGRDRVLGSIGLDHYGRQRVFSAEEKEMFSAIVRQVGLAMDNAQLVARLRNRTDRLEALVKLSQVIASSLDRDMVLSQAAEQLCLMMDADHCGIMLLQPDGETGLVVAEYPPVGMIGICTSLTHDPLYEGLSFQSVAVVYQDSTSSAEVTQWLAQNNIQTLMTARIIGRDRLLGSIGIDMLHSKRTYTAEEREIFQAAVRQVALAIDNTELYTKALTANELKSQFLATMSHELRTPMNAIIGYTEMILTGIYGPLTVKQQDRLDRVYNNAKNLLALINDVLDLSKIESGHLVLEMEITDVVPLVLGAVGSIAAIAEAKQLRLISEIATTVPRVMVDSMRLRQIVLNFLSNAVKFTREGSITIRIRPFTTEAATAPITIANHPLPAGQWLAIEIEDTGVGIDPSHFELIFDAFRQVDGSFTRVNEGTGLGLAITRQLVELHQGHIILRSVVGTGSTFTCMLPLPRRNSTAQISAV